MKDLKQLKLFLLDMDGTIYLDDELFDGVQDFLAHIRSIGGRYIFLTNNSSKGTRAYVEKLNRLGIPATDEDMFTSAHATILHLQHRGYQKIYVFGTQSLKEQLHAAGLPITDRLEDGIDCLCAGFDTELTFQKLEDACILLNRGVDFVATNPDWVCPTWYGSVPDCGSVCEMLFRATGRRPQFIGKPQPEMALLAMEKAGFTKEQTALIGDRLYTDIACGINAGVCSIFVLSGEGTLDDLAASEAKPDFVYDNVKALLQDLI